MSIGISDIKRAILSGGDVSTFTEVCHQALANPPVISTPSLEVPLVLPETMVLLNHVDEGLEPLLAGWVEGRHHQPLPKTKIDLTLIGVAPYGRNIGRYLEHIIDEVRPDIIALDTSPLGLSAAMLYAFSISCAVGLPAYGEILTRESGQFYASETFYPGNMSEVAIIKSWLSKIPLLPIGVPQKPKRSELGSQLEYADETYLDRETSKSSVLTAYRTLDESLSNVSQLQEGAQITRDICLSLTKTISSKMREVLAEEACYVASRITEIAAYVNAQGRQARLLAIVDIAHYSDTEYLIGFLSQGITDEIYVAPKNYAIATDMVMVGRDSDKLNEQAKEYAPKSTFAQELFRSEFDRLIKSKESEILPESEVDKLISEIVRRTRNHPDIARGASVRGTIAFKEVLRGLSEMRNGLTRDNISKAALITLPARISGRQGNNERAIVSDIVKEVLYDIRFSEVRGEAVSSFALDRLSPKDIAESLKNLTALSPEQRQKAAQKTPSAIIIDPDRNQALLKSLESKKLLQKRQQTQRLLTAKALEYLMNELDQKLRDGKITLDEYNQEKGQLMAMLRGTSQPQFKMSAKELANTIMELMDAQDRQWTSEMSFERMHIYYHIKANSGEDQLSPQKRNYYELKTLIGDLEKQGILRAGEAGTDFTLLGKAGTDFTLTSEALEILLEYLVARDPRGLGLQNAKDFGKTLDNERKHEIRRYTSGDVYRNISIRHTLKEIAKQKKDLSDVRRSDFRVFLKQRRKSQSDIVLCLDTSGSMGVNYKLMYARLAATGLAKAAIENGDRVGMVAFDNSSQTTVPLTEKDKDAIVNHIVRLSARGNTNIGDGIKCASELLFQDRAHNQKYILLITDGQPTAISQGTFNQLKALKEKDLTEESALLETRKASSRGVKVSVIHIAGKGEGGDELAKNIARAGRGKVRRMSSPEDLETIMRQ